MMTRTVRNIAGVVVLVLVVGLAAGCTSLFTGERATDESGGVGVAPPPETVTNGAPSPDQGVSEPVPPKGDVANVADADRLIIQSKTLRLEVESTSATVDAIRALAKEHSGVITDLQVASDTEDWLYYYDASGMASEALRGWVTVRVPAAGFEAFIEAASKLGTVKYQSEASEDVTQQHVDMAARLENLRAEETRLRQFFDSAKTVADMLAIEQELSRVRGEIESLDAQVKYLERQAAMATVTIELTEPKAIVRPEGESWGFAEAITTGIRGAANVVNVAITFLIATVPLWGTGLIGFFLVRTIVRRRRAKRSTCEWTGSSTASAPRDDSPDEPAAT